jgi:hypothetical protein
MVDQRYSCFAERIAAALLVLRTTPHVLALPRSIDQHRLHRCRPAGPAPLPRRRNVRGSARRARGRVRTRNPSLSMITIHPSDWTLIGSAQYWTVWTLTGSAQ